jgi:hypothetical protein
MSTNDDDDVQPSWAGLIEHWLDSVAATEAHLPMADELNPKGMER